MISVVDELGRSRSATDHVNVNIYMFYLGLLVPPCTHTEGPRFPRPVALFTLNHRVFWSLVLGRRPSSRTVVPCPGPSSLVPDPRPSSWTLVPRPGPSSLVPDPRFGRSELITYFMLVVPMFIYLSQYVKNNELGHLTLAVQSANINK